MTVGPPLVGDTRATQVADLDVALGIPVGFERKKPTVWTLDAGGSRHAMLWVQREKTPEAGVDAFVQKATEQLGRGGMAGVTRRETVEIADLEGHFVEAVTVVGSQRSVAMQLVVGAEDGMYMVSLIATVAAMKLNRKAFEACVKSLRIPPR